MRRQRSGKGGCSMKNYDFHHLLEPVEFQEFARDMIQVREKYAWKRSGKGRIREWTPDASRLTGNALSCSKEMGQ